ncbi:hypothetical protein GO986_08660 [Deinococcus sp. HMF7620]|uniref:Uncharacterized protein n=1 Tax=Deinococcus arboris TaxID=2682977 RepID=A0A7C9HRG9_9DEIO|nr:hypothetical protein [Deinococcus arboris]MVN86833.1 hypothetical protein [Deinococcus arboris]
MLAPVVAGRWAGASRQPLVDTQGGLEGLQSWPVQRAALAGLRRKRGRHGGEVGHGDGIGLETGQSVLKHSRQLLDKDGGKLVGMGPAKSLSALPFLPDLNAPELLEQPGRVHLTPELGI